MLTACERENLKMHLATRKRELASTPGDPKCKGCASKADGTCDAWKRADDKHHNYDCYQKAEA